MIIYFYFNKTKSCNYQTQIPEVKYFLSVQKQCMTPQRQAMCPFKLFVTTIKTCTEVKEKLESENIKSCTLKHDYEGHQCYSILLVRTGFVTEPKAKLYRCYPWSSTWLCHRPAHLLLYCFTRSVLCMREHALGFTKEKNGVSVPWSVSFVPPHSPPPQSHHLGHRPSSDGCSAGPPGCSDRPRSYMAETPPYKGLHGSGNQCHYIDYYVTEIGAIENIGRLSFKGWLQVKYFPLYHHCSFFSRYKNRLSYTGIIWLLAYKGIITFIYQWIILCYCTLGRSPLFVYPKSQQVNSLVSLKIHLRYRPASEICPLFTVTNEKDWVSYTEKTWSLSLFFKI